MPALPPASVPTIAFPSPGPAPVPGPAPSPYNGSSSYQYMPSPTWPSPSSPDAGQSVGSGGALLSLSPVTTVEGETPLRADPLLDLTLQFFDPARDLSCEGIVHCFSAHANLVQPINNAMPVS